MLSSGPGGQLDHGQTVLIVVSSGLGALAVSRTNSADSGKWWPRGVSRVRDQQC